MNNALGAVLPAWLRADVQRIRMLLTFGGGQLLIILLLVLMSQTLSRQRDIESAARERLYQSFEARSEIAQLLSSAQDIETGQRGFVITGDPEYLQPYRGALDALKLRLSRLAALPQSRTYFSEHIEQLKELTAARVKLAAEAIKVREQGSLVRAAEVVSKGQGKRVMDQIRNLVTEMQRIEALNLRSAMHTEQAVLARSRNLTYGLGGAVAGLSLFGGILGFVLVDRRRQAERKAERQSGIVKLLSEIADASNQATFDEALAKTLKVVLRDTQAPWGMTIRFDPLKRMAPVANWQPEPQGSDPPLLAWYVADHAERLSGPTLLDIPPSCGLPSAVPSCSLVPIRDGEQVAGALLVAGPRPGPEETDREAARIYTIEQLSRAAERQRMLDTLTDTLARHEALFFSASDGIITVNESNTIERVNPAAEALFGYTAAEIERRDFGLLLDESGGPLDSLARRLLIGAGAPNSIAREATGRRKDGTVLPVEISLSVMNLGDRNVFVAFVRDISERKRVERMQAEFISTVSHELRTPLTSIGGSLGLIAGGAAGEISDRARRLVEIAHKNSQRLIRLVNDILDIEKLQSGKMSFQFASVAVDEFLAQVVAANRGFAEGYGVQIVSEGSASGKVIHADSDRLNQAVTNLISNAVKFSPPGSTVVVRLGCTEHGVRLSVVDHGPGIPEEFRKRIFERFAQADSSDTRQTGGSGLGLSIAREIVTRHGGSLTYETEIGRGTTFHLHLPVAPQVRQEPLLSSPAERDLIAICADDGSHAESFRAVLTSQGLDCSIFLNVEDALHGIANSPFRAVVIGLPLRELDVSQFVRALRDRSASAVMPVILVSSDEAASDLPDLPHAFPILDWISGPEELACLPDRLRSLSLRATPERPRLLHVEDDRDVQEIVRQTLEGEFNVTAASTLGAARLRLAEHNYDVVILDLTLGDGLGQDLIPDVVNAAGDPIPTVIFSAQDATPELARNVEAVLTKSRANLGTLVEAVRAVVARPPDQHGRKREGAV